MFSMVFGELGTLREQSKQASLHKKTRRIPCTLYIENEEVVTL